MMAAAAFRDLPDAVPELRRAVGLYLAEAPD